VLGGVIQAFLVNGRTTNDSDCAISLQDCWSWGLPVKQYYAVIFVILLVLLVLCIRIPILFFREIDCSDIPQHTLEEHTHDFWETLKNLTTMFLLIFVFGNMVPITTSFD
jgi:hypothetical protein